MFKLHESALWWTILVNEIYSASKVKVISHKKYQKILKNGEIKVVPQEQKVWEAMNFDVAVTSLFLNIFSHFLWLINLTFEAE